jgi:RNA polymerase sigma-54 factor
VIATLTLEARPQLEVHASPELIAYAGLLALPAVELEQAIEHELSLNPALERVDCPVCPFCGEPLAGWRCLVCPPAGRHPAPDGRPDPALRAEPSTIDILLAELRPLAQRADVPILEHLIGSLDERGFLDARPDEIAARLEVSRAHVERVIALVRGHGPPGIAATDLRECLLLQLDGLGSEPGIALAREVVADHLEQLASGCWNAIAEALGVTRDEVAATAEFIRARLRPSAPLDLAEHASPAPLALPDVIVREREDRPGTFAVELVEPRRLRVVVAPAFADADVRQLEPETRTLVEEYVTEARSFLRRLDRRWQTMRAVAEHVVERQRDFILSGPRFITPLTRAEIAAELGMHESTVSRATNGRYVLLPSGRVVPFSRFFDTAQGPCAALAQLVAEEQSPTSDAKLAAELGQLGFPIARRTVAKYRERLGIPPHTRRRCEAAFAPGAPVRSGVRRSTA